MGLRQTGREYIPRDSEYVDSILYPINTESIDTASSSPFSGIPTPNKKDFNWQIFPNPAYDVLNVIPPDGSSFDESNSFYLIYTLMGSQVKEGIISRNTVNSGIDIRSLQQGIYFLELRNASNIQKYKFVRE